MIRWQKLRGGAPTQDGVLSLVCSKLPSSFKKLLCAEPGWKIRVNTIEKEHPAGCFESCLFIVPLLLVNLLCPHISPWLWWGCNWRVGDIYMGSLITDNTSPDTFLPTQGGGWGQKRPGEIQTWSQMRRQKPQLTLCVFMCEAGIWIVSAETFSDLDRDLCVFSRDWSDQGLLSSALW